MNLLKTPIIGLTKRCQFCLGALDMTRHADVSPHPPNQALRIDQEGRPDDAHESVSVELLFLPDAVGVPDRAILSLYLAMNVL